MRFSSFAVLAAATLASAAPTVDIATVVVEASHGGAFNDRTNQTLSVPIGSVYVDEHALNAVSTLYLLGPNGVTCTPYKAKDGTGNRGLPFSVGKPSYLSTNTVVVGSIQCLRA
ncbi:hypothetical protein F4808DRAFT_421191 [Astrocystis sublimbata]|nr:hypothetical protein F4808DRAFT_421191 [Astrocystis sublimbata]